MNNIILKIKEFMAGRNGFDKLTYGLLVVYCLIAAIKLPVRGIFPAYIVISILQYLFLCYIIFRIMSRNLQKRYNETFKFEQFIAAWKPHFNHLKLRITYFRTYRFRTCKNCGEFLRLKRIRGKRKIMCPKCGKDLNFYILF